MLESVNSEILADKFKDYNILNKYMIFLIKHILNAHYIGRVLWLIYYLKWWFRQMTIECGQNLLQDIRTQPELEIQNHRRDCNTRQTEKLYKTIQSYTALSVKRGKKIIICVQKTVNLYLLSRVSSVGN